MPGVRPLTNASPRLAAFDGLRGLAALAVALSHAAALVYVPWGHMPATHMQFALWHLGAPSVDLFFVLSGWVIARSLQRDPAFWPYLARRAARLLPVAYLAVGLGFAVRGLAVRAGPDFSVLVTHDLRAALTASDVIGMLTVSFPALHANALMPPLWSLVVEVQVAPLMPLITRATRSCWAVVGFAVLGVLLALRGWEQAVFFPLFALGAWASRLQWRLSQRAATLALLLGLAVLLQRHLTGSDFVLVRYLTAPGAALVLLAVQAGAARPFLTHPWAQALGRVSYPLYATHFPVLLAGGVATSRVGFSPLLGAALALPVALVLAWGVHVRLERPFQPHPVDLGPVRHA